jgi:hypothetical protein
MICGVFVEEPLVRFLFEQNFRNATMMGARLGEGQTKEEVYADYLRQHIDNLVEVAENDDTEGSI